MVRQSELFAPVALFVFNRPRHMERAVFALASNEFAAQTPLFVFSDGARDPDEQRNVDEVRRQAKNIAGFKSVTIVERDENIGLAASIVEGVSYLCEQYGSVIVLEDDLVTSPDFLRFMNQGLQLYAENSKVASIHGYAYPVTEGNIPESYFLRGADCWGWATCVSVSCAPSNVSVSPASTKPWPCRTRRERISFSQIECRIENSQRSSRVPEMN